VNSLVSVEEARRLIALGRPLMFAGDERLLRALPRGQWIGGTIPYFMSTEGGKKTASQLFVTRFPDDVTEAAVQLYPVEALATIPSHYPDNGASFIVLPAFSRAHVEFAQGCAGWKGLFDRPLVGWIAGVDLAEVSRVKPGVLDGVTGEWSQDAAVVLHLKLPAGCTARVDIVNLFTQGDGAALSFPTQGFEVTDCLVDGAPRNFAEYVAEQGLDTRLPLVADYSGVKVNISFRAISGAVVSLYAPVVPGMTYRLARPLDDEYADAFQRELAARAVSPAFACNCILNYVYGGLEGKKTGVMTGPITFGEVAYMLLNQTIVYVDLERR
jgi:hypothetical protein